MTTFDRILAILLSLYMTLVPFSSVPAEPTDAKNESAIMLDVALISDVHVKGEGSKQHQNLENGLKNLSANFPKLDAMAVSGDLTNGGEEVSLKLFYEALLANTSLGKYIVAPGNHDIGHSPLSNSEARKVNIELMNRYLGYENEEIYYSQDVNGYTFIVIGDDIGDKSNTPVMSDKQIKFLDEELAKATAEGKPAFVICHWPLAHTNGIDILWPGGGVNNDNSEKLKTVMEKYKNVFVISGHTHVGLSSDIFSKIFGYSFVETKNGVTYVSVPCFGKFNRHIPFSPSIFLRMEVYANKVVFRPYNLRSLKWYPKYDKTVTLNNI